MNPTSDGTNSEENSQDTGRSVPPDSDPLPEHTSSAAAGGPFTSPLPTWMTPTAFIAGLVFITVILVFVIVFPNPTESQFNILRTIIALASAAFSMPFTGFISSRLNLPYKGYIVSGGAFAIVIIVYLTNILCISMMTGSHHNY